MSRTKRGLDADFEMRGFWWLPSAEDVRVSGTLRFVHDDGIALELDGTLRPDGFDPNGIFAPETVLGETHDGKDCTLFHAHESGRRGCIPGIETAEMSASYLLVGGHFETVDAAAFAYLDIRFTYLEEWLDRRPFSSEHPEGRDGQPEVHARYVMPRARRIRVDSLDATVAFRSNVTTRPGTRKHNIEHADMVRIRPRRSRPFEWFWSAAYDLRRLLSLLVWEPVFPLRMTAGLRKFRAPSGTYLWKTADIFFAQKALRRKESLSPFMMLLPYAAVRKSWSEVANRWFQSREKLRPVHSLLLGNLHEPSPFLQYRFLAHTQAAESFHRVRSDGRHVPAGEYEGYRSEMCDAIPTGMPKPLKDAIKAKLKYGNEYSLRKRLKLLLRGLSGETRRWLAPKEDAFVAGVVDTRNYLTHYDPALKVKALDGEGLSRLDAQLQKLILVLLLKDLGVDEAKVVRAVSGHGRFRRRYVSW